MIQHIFKRGRYVIGWVFFKICSLINGFLPLPIIYILSDIWGILFYHLGGRFRRVSFESLRSAFGRSYSQSQQAGVLKRTMKNFMRVGLELLAFIYRPYLVGEFVSVRNRSYLDNALKRGKGIVGLTGHFGNFPLLCLKLVSLGYKVNVMVRPVRDRRMDKEITALRTKVGVKTIYSYPRSSAVRESLQALRNNEILIIQMDQNFGTGGVWVDFFGRRAATPKGPVVFALRTQASIIPMFIVRDSANPKKQTVIIERPQVLEKAKGVDETVYEYVQRFTTLLEGYIKEYPDHWGWMHRRWKSKEA